MVVLPPTNELPVLNTNYIFYWNNVALDLIRLTHTSTVSGPQRGPPMTARAMGILQLAVHDAYFATRPDPQYSTYLTPAPQGQAPYVLPDPLGASDSRLAVAGAAITVLQALYTTRDSNVSDSSIGQINQLLDGHINAFPDLDTLSSSFRFGVDVGNAMLSVLAIQPGEPGADQGNYRPLRAKQRFGFDDDPTNPVRIAPNSTRAERIYDAPFYGMTAKRIAVQHVIDGEPTEHIIADPPAEDRNGGEPEYEDAFKDVYRMGGRIELNTTKRRPDQTAEGLFWAYDGANLIGVPLRIYNEVVRKVAFDRKVNPDHSAEDNNAEYARLFALVNASLADAGIFAWQEKYCFEYWRPLSGVRDDSVVGRSKGRPLQDPFWLGLGAPNTNTNEISFKPPFPAYPSGHATFGAAAFQSMRLYYKQRDNLPYGINQADNIAFDFVSDELNGVSRDLRDPYDPTRPITEQRGTVRNYFPKAFQSLWHAIFSNAVSRVFLGVHWRFDAFASADTLVPNMAEDADTLYALEADGTTAYKPAEAIRYETLGTRLDRPDEGRRFPIGGVPLGINIANDIFQGGLKPTPAMLQPVANGRFRCGWNERVEAARREGSAEGSAEKLVEQKGGARNGFVQV